MTVDQALAALGGDRDRVRAVLERHAAEFHLQLSAIELAAAMLNRPDRIEAVRTVRAWIEEGCR